MELVHKLDEYGKPAWIGLMIAGFVVFWPIGLAILGYMMWSGRMGCFKRSRGQWWKSESRSSGNAAFDDYKAETLRRLEEEQQEFQDFLEQLRRAKDKAEFDQFMASRRNRPDGTAPDASPA